MAMYYVDYRLANAKPPSQMKSDIKERLLLIAKLVEILHKKSNTFEDKKLSAQLDRIYNDLIKLGRDSLKTLDAPPNVILLQ